MVRDPKPEDNEPPTIFFVIMFVLVAAIVGMSFFLGRKDNRDDYRQAERADRIMVTTQMIDGQPMVQLQRISEDQCKWSLKVMKPLEPNMWVQCERVEGKRD